MLRIWIDSTLFSRVILVHLYDSDRDPSILGYRSNKICHISMPRDPHNSSSIVTWLCLIWAIQTLVVTSRRCREGGGAVESAVPGPATSSPTAPASRISLRPFAQSRLAVHHTLFFCVSSNTMFHSHDLFVYRKRLRDFSFCHWRHYI